MNLKPSTELLRRQNMLAVLKALRLKGGLSHTELSELTGLASATVTAVTTELERTGAIERQEQSAPSGRGRPRVLFQRASSHAHAISVQISSDALHYALSDYRGTLIDRFSTGRDIANARPARMIEEISQSLDRLMTRSRLAPEAILHLSLSSKGIVDAEQSRLVWSPVLGREDVDFSTLTRPYQNATLTLSNESLLVVQALGKRLLLREDQQRSPGLIALSLGHSIGLGVAKEEGGDIIATAPNFGHMLNAPDNRLCRCGAYGCIEASAGFYGILRLAFQVPPNTIPAKFVPIAEMEKIALSARQNNRMAQYAFRQAGIALGQGLSRVLSMVGDMPIAVTGPGSRFYDLLSVGLEEGLSQTLHARLNGMPNISIVSDEQSLVFEGHVDLALAAIDQRLTQLR
ncbi:ROK family protein [Rhizobium helianthi]|uniref:ROK family protein n=1 Tax=Rhizobium helianthi TaxID=1132695 RepID=A0ABW4M5C8_9HYPH